MLCLCKLQKVSRSRWGFRIRSLKVVRLTWPRYLPTFSTCPCHLVVRDCFKNAAIVPIPRKGHKSLVVYTSITLKYLIIMHNMPGTPLKMLSFQPSTTHFPTWSIPTYMSGEQTLFSDLKHRCSSGQTTSDSKHQQKAVIIDF